MIDQWFKKDLNKIFEKHNTAVFIDPSGEAKFLLDTLPDDCRILQAHSNIEELELKYIIEKGSESSQKNLIYTQRPIDKLLFIREYCEIYGNVNIPDIYVYIKRKVYDTTKLNLNLDRNETIAAGMVSAGKPVDFWANLCRKGAEEIFDMTKELLPFLNNPEAYAATLTDDLLRDHFYRKATNILGQKYFPQPAKTLAKSLVTMMLDGLANNTGDKVLDTVYYSWLDSKSRFNSFVDYLKKYKLPAAADYKSAHPHHPFREIDEKYLAEIGQGINNSESISEHIARIKQRSLSKQAKSMGITFWADVLVLLDFDSKKISTLSSLSDCIKFYTKHFYKLDTALRNLYVEFLNKEELLRPLNDRYKGFIEEYGYKWFQYFNQYEENQTGTLQHIINENNNNNKKIAIIVGDAVSYEISESVAVVVNRQFKLTKKTIKSDFPSITENNISRIYMANGMTEKHQNKREKYLSAENSDKKIDYIMLNDVSEEAKPNPYLICTFKDIDDMGENQQQEALKYFPKTIDFLAQKIETLLKSGYTKVYLISDHGFVLTGPLRDSGKISLDFSGENQPAERYIRTVERQSFDKNYIYEAEKKHGDYNYAYFSKTINPFKTRGVYGFSHGGISSQELLTPLFCWENPLSSINPLKVQISNKADLKELAGEYFEIKIQSGPESDNLFATKRKVYLVFFVDGNQTAISDIFTIIPGETLTKEYSFDGQKNKEAQLRDADTKQVLDQVTVTQNSDRDLGGL